MFIFLQFVCIFSYISYAFLLIFHENWLQTHFLASMSSTLVLTPALIDQIFLTLGLTNLALGINFPDQICVSIFTFSSHSFLTPPTSVPQPVALIPRMT